ncbi:MAG: SIR2 family protein [Paludibacter sp.]|nr:SIR2 family protein [Paludibacter sp.]
MEIDWSKENILKLNNEIKYYENNAFEFDECTDEEVYAIENTISSIREKIEPWLTSIFQSEHFSLLLGTGFTIGLTQLAEVKSQAMGRIEFTEFKDEIKTWAEETAIDLGRGSANIEDDFRTAIELLQGLKILKAEEVISLESEINLKLNEFINAIIKTENEFAKSAKYIDALSVLKSFLISFSSRAASRERTNIFTTNYDRFIEFGLDSAGILTIDRFIGKIKPVFRTTKLELDYHYNPPGIRGEPRYVEGVIKYIKLHGSVDWKFENDSIVKLPLNFGVSADESQYLIPKEPKDFSVIYPNSSKGIDTAYFPYSELFRDFSSAVCRPNSVIVTFGYGFGDSHINRVIKDMLTIPSTHLVIISFDNASGRIEKFIEEINSAQITLIIGKYLASIKPLVENYLPKAAIDRIQDRMFKNLEKRKVVTPPKTNEFHVKAEDNE